MFGIVRSPKKIVFGRGQRKSLTKEVLLLGRRALICTDQRMAQQRVFHEIVQELNSASIETAVFSDTVPELPISNIRASVDVARRFKPDVVIGIGGGSCLDLSKITAMMVNSDDPIESFYGELNVTAPITPLIAIPTTAGTGSEVTPVAVLNDTDRQLKVGIASPYLIPLVAICDPDLTDTSPKILTAVSGADALAHAIEAFTALRRAPTAQLGTDQVFIGKNDLSDIYALRAIELLYANLQRVVDNLDDKDARDAVMLGSLLAGLAFGTAGTAAAHAIQYPIGAITKTPHGLGVACILPYVMRFNLREREEEFGQIGRAIGLTQSGTVEEFAAGTIEVIASLLKEIGIPETLDEIGITEKHTDEVARGAMVAARLINNNPRKITAADVTRIVRSAMRSSKNATSADIS